MSDLGPWGKLYQRTFTGSLVGKGSTVIAVWCYCIAHMRPPHGDVDLNPALLAATLGETVEKINSAIEFLCSPDPDSRDEGHDGSRLLRIDTFTYRGVKFPTYRAGRQPEERREQVRAAVQRHRARKASSNVIQPVINGKPRKAQAEAEAEEEEKTLSGKPDDAASQDVLAYLNEKAGRHYRPVPSQLKFIRARMEEGATVEEMKAVVDNRVEAWKADAKMSAYLRPETLFNATKYETYRQEVVAKPAKKRWVGV